MSVPETETETIVTETNTTPWNERTQYPGSVSVHSLAS